MAVLQRVRFISQERVDLPDLLNLDAFGNADWSAFVNSFITGVNSPFVVTGFDITDPEALINVATSTVDINIANGVLFNPESTGGAGAFYIGPPTAPAQAVFLTANATNFIEVDQTTSLGAVDTRAIWDAAGGPDGTGQEFSQAIDTVTNLDVAIFGNTVGFTSGRAPIAKIVVNSSGVITSITDCRDLLFRLGTGGATPNPAFVYPWPQTQTDNPVTLTSSVGANPFQGADKAIMSLKDWMNAVMTEIGRVKGNGVPWFASVTESGSFTETFLDAVGSVLTSGTGAGTFNWNAGTNTLTWSDDLYVRTVAGGPYFFVIKAGSGTLNTGEVLWLQQVRDTPLPDNVPLSFTNGSSYVNVSSPGAFTGLVSDATAGSGFGDWIRKEIDNPDKYGRILNFYAGANGSGGVTTAAAALSVHLSGNYTGTTSGAGGDLAFYAAGSYTVTNTAALGLPWSTQNYWLATRWGTGTSQCYVRDSGILKDGETRIVGYEIPESLELTGNLTVDGTSTLVGNTNITGTLSGTGGTLDVSGIESVSGSSATALLDSANTGAGASIEADSSGGTGYGLVVKGNATKAPITMTPQVVPSTPAAGDLNVPTAGLETLNGYRNGLWRAMEGYELLVCETTSGVGVTHYSFTIPSSTYVKVIIVFFNGLGAADYFKLVPANSAPSSGYIFRQLDVAGGATTITNTDSGGGADSFQVTSAGGNFADTAPIYLEFEFFGANDGCSTTGRCAQTVAVGATNVNVGYSGRNNVDTIGGGITGFSIYAGSGSANLADMQIQIFGKNFS